MKEERLERELELLRKKEKIAELDRLIEEKSNKMKTDTTLLKEKVLQHISIKKIIPRNFQAEGISKHQKIPIPFVGLRLRQQDADQKILLQMSQDKDILSLYSEAEVLAFTENDVFDGIGIRNTRDEEIINLIQPQHLQFVRKIFEKQFNDLKVDEGEIDKEN